MKMEPLKILLTLPFLADLASRSNLRSGQQIVKDGDVKILDKNTFNLVAHVQHGQGARRTVELMSTPKGFRYRCACTARKDLFCKHCVAVGLVGIS